MAIKLKNNRKPTPKVKKPSFALVVKPPEPMPEPANAREIAALLGETTRSALWQIGNWLQLVGRSAVLELLKETLAVEQADGMRTSDGTKRRTPGGVFFKLAKQRYGREYRAFVRALYRSQNVR